MTALRMRYSILFLWLAGLFSNGTGLIFTLLANRQLTLAEMGNLGLFTNLVMLASIGSVALGVTTNRFHALYVEKKNLAAYSFTSSLGMLSLTIGLFVGLSYLATSPWWTLIFNFPYSWKLLCITGAVFVIMFPIAWLRSVLQAHTLYSIVGVGLLIEGIIKIIIGIIASKSIYPFGVFMSAMAIASAITFLVMLFPFRKIVTKVLSQKKSLDKSHWIFLSQTLIQRVSVISLLTIDTIFAKYYLSPDQAGVYVLLSLSGKMIYFLSQSIYVLVTPVLSPFLNQEIKRKRIFAGLITATSIIIATISIAYLIYPQYSLELMFGSRYALIAPFVFRYSLASGLLSLVLIASLYKLLRQQYAVSGFVIFGLLIEIVLMVLRHKSIQDIVNNLLYSSIAMIFFLVLIFLLQKPVLQRIPLLIKPS